MHKKRVNGLIRLASTVKNVNNKKLILCGVILSLILLASLVGVFILRFYVRDFSNIKDTNYYDKYYVLITEDRNSEFWQSVYKGAYEEGLKNGVYVELLGDKLSDDYTKEEMMTIAISEDVDGIIVDADEGSAMTSLINEATKKGIPVITAYHDNNSSKRLSFVGMGSYNMGRMYGQQVLQLAEKVKRQKADAYDGTCDVIMLETEQDNQTWQDTLRSGINEAIKQDEYATANLNVNIQLEKVNDTNKYSAEEFIRDIFMQENLPDIIICLNEVNTQCVYQAIVDYNKVGQIRVLGYYDLNSTLKAIERGVVDATISLDTNQMGHYCVEALQEYYDQENVSQFFAADVFLINSNNVSDFKEGNNNENKED